MNDATGERLKRALSDRYAIQREIDRGGMAAVYLARDSRHNRNVAIKVLQPTLAATVATERFLREIEVTASLQHPNILTLIDSGVADGLPYYVMPFVEGQSLKDLLQREGPLPLEVAVRIASEAADALAYAHGKGVIHRDIKPGNVLVSAGHAVVADFGIAAALDDAAVGRLTDTGLSLGSPAYMSPEQAMGEKSLDPRADIYCLGCVLYEMLAGKPPFEGSVASLMAQKIVGEFRPLEAIRPDVPPAIDRAVSRAMATAPADRFTTAEAFRQALAAGLPRTVASGWNRARSAAAAAVVLAVILASAVIVRTSRAEGARVLLAAQTLAEVEDLIDQGRYTEALTLAEPVESEFPGDTTLARLLPTFTFTVPIRTDPPGARVYLQRMDQPEDEWVDLGRAPLAGVRFPGWTFDTGENEPAYEAERPYRFRFELDGYQPRELHLIAVTGVSWQGLPGMDPVVLTPEDPETDGMVRIPGFAREGVEYADFYMDRFEVTNREFKEFVDAGGYRSPELWQHPFVVEGRELTFAEAMTRFEDRTGRPGPATWSVGDFPEGQEDYPVGGVSWHEAAAYARWRGKELPTAAHWGQATLYFRDRSYVIVPRSNLGGDGPRAVGQDRAMTSLGVYDLVGNVREWCFNEAGQGARATRGAAWTDAPFLVQRIVPKQAFDRDETNGIRLIRTSDPEDAIAKLRFPVQQTVVRDFSSERPASDAEFEIFRRLYDYDPVPPNARVERSDTFPHWVREQVAFDLPYGERGGVILYLPKEARRPLQPVVYWGGSGLLQLRSVEDEFLIGFDFLVRSGRAVALPIFAGSYGRTDPRPQAAWGTSTPGASGSNAYRDIAIQWVKDVRATIDYLETRDDVDSEHVGFFGWSFGGRAGVVPMAIEPRIDAAVLNVGGLGLETYPPEVDVFNFASRVRIPVLMLNGQYDVVFPYESSQRPLFELLGTPPEHKTHVLFPASHVVPQNELITHTLDWFDKYLGVPAGG